ncbi:hypothetical protein ACQPWY_14720 [Pseudonocardia xinjiangensis]|uniref:hypothetical protein n=1 Tax=Pseudonocardia xinjiangensis TaxID=75289 RepID=UPI003D8CB9BE
MPRQEPRGCCVISGRALHEDLGALCAEVFVQEGAKVLAADISGGQIETAAPLGPSVRAR